MTLTISRYGPGLQADGVPGGPWFARPDETHLLADGYQYAELLRVPDEGAARVDGFAYPTPDGAEVRLRAGANGWHMVSLTALRALVSGLSVEPVACARCEA